MSFQDLARQRQLKSVMAELGILTWDVEPDGYQRLKAPPSADVTPLLRLLLRRSLEPALVSILLERFEHRPLERALLAWDAAAGALLSPEDDAFLQVLRSHLSPLKQLGTSAAVAVPRDRVAALIAAVRALGERPMSEGADPQISLASVAALTANDTVAIDAALEFSGRLALAHLPSFALAIAQILWEQLKIPAALDAAIEIGLDFERFDSIPLMDEQRQFYVAARGLLAQLSLSAADSILEKAPADPKLTVARAELQVLRGKTPGSFDAPLTWRYGSRVDHEIRMQQSPEQAPLHVESYLTSFGNDMRVWAQAGLVEQARAPLLALASREVRFCSHDPEAWRALMVFLDDGTPIEIELQQRLAAQLAIALS